MTRMLASALACALGASAAAQTAAPAAVPAPAPRLANLKVMGCEDFLRLNDVERNAVVWYVAGDFKEAGRTATRFDLDLSGQAVPAVVKACNDKPQANLLYTAVSWFKAHAPKPEKKKPGKK